MTSLIAKGQFRHSHRQNISDIFSDNRANSEGFKHGRQTLSQADWQSAVPFVEMAVLPDAEYDNSNSAASKQQVGLLRCDRCTTEDKECNVVTVRAGRACETCCRRKRTCSIKGIPRRKSKKFRNEPPHKVARSTLVSLIALAAFKGYIVPEGFAGSPSARTQA
jgi:hypothetical protein